MEKPKIYTYLDYRIFLRDMLAFRKSQKQRTKQSLRDIAKRCNLAPSYISMVISGKRKLSSKDSLNKLVNGFELKSSEKKFFELLVELEKVKSPANRANILSRMARFKSYAQLNSLDRRTFTYLSKWYNVAIREMSQMPDFIPNAKWIQQRLNEKVSVVEIDEALEFLLKNDFIQINDLGGIIPANTYMDCSDKVLSIALANFHRQIFTVIVNSIDSVERSKRQIVGQTFALDESKFDRAAKILNKAYEDVNKLCSEESSGNTVYHIIFGLCPLTKGDI